MSATIARKLSDCCRKWRTSSAVPLSRYSQTRPTKRWQRGRIRRITCQQRADEYGIRNTKEAWAGPYPFSLCLAVLRGWRDAGLRHPKIQGVTNPGGLRVFTSRPARSEWSCGKVRTTLTASAVLHGCKSPVSLPPRTGAGTLKVILKFVRGAGSFAEAAFLCDIRHRA
jgi:hypothetical protein